MSLPLAPLDGRITLKGPLGAGGMGEVHRAWDSALERPVAVKFVRGSDPKEADRLLLEARLQARVEHPHVVRVHDTGTLEGRPCIVMQLVEGRTFAELGPTSEWQVKVALAAQAARGLGAAHRTGLVHRDVKPANILVEDAEAGPEARLSDFGLARDDEGGLTRSGLLVGTVDFMAPEQVTGSAPVDFRADIYGLGATLYAVLTGRPPFRASQGLTAAAPDTRDLQGDTPAGELHPGDFLRRILEEEPRPLTGLAPDLPKDLAVVVAKAMEKDPARRYGTAEAFAEDLDRVLRGEPVLARAIGLLERGGRWARRYPIPARTLGTVAALALAALAFAGWTSFRSRTQSLEAARMGSLAEGMVNSLRMAYLSPAFDQKPVLAGIRAQVDHLRARPMGEVSPAGLFVVGKGLEALGDDDGARPYLEAAWAQGFRTPEAAESLGFLLGRLYFKAMDRARESLAPKARERREAEAKATFLQPATELLQQAAGSGWQRAYREAYLLYLQGRFEESRAKAALVLQEDPSRYEALRLQATTDEREISTAFQTGKTEGVQARIDAMGSRVDEALRWGRSDPALLKLKARNLHFQAVLLRLAGKDGAELLAREEGIIQHLQALEGDSFGSLVSQGNVCWERSNAARDSHRERMPGFLRSAAGFYRRAADLAPGDVGVRNTLALLCVDWMLLLKMQGQPREEPLRIGLKATEEGEKLGPNMARSRFVAMQLNRGEGEALDDEGGDAEAVYRRGIQKAGSLKVTEGPDALQLDSHLAYLHGQLSRVVFRKGGDPDPEIAQAAEAARRMREHLDLKSVEAVLNWNEVVTNVADAMVEFGGDPKALLDLARATSDEAIKLRPDAIVLVIAKVPLLSVEASRCVQAGVDPAPILAEMAARLEQTKGPFGSTIVFWQTRALHAVIEGEALARQGRDPAKGYQRARPILEEMVRKFPGFPWSAAYLVHLPVLEARWRHGQKLPYAHLAQPSLRSAEQIVVKFPRGIQTWVDLAALRAMAGNPKGAKEAWDKALALNPRAPDLPDYRGVRELVFAEEPMATRASR
ncbi:MAG: serine/threonine protein kinase [Acidobacteria bacterium]|nr:serine/threonine protein kinase [Acidobacteriota bacterium]